MTTTLAVVSGAAELFANAAAGTVLVPSAPVVA